MPQAVVSVVIPTRNRARMLAQALRAILVQDLTAHEVLLEVVVVDEGSTDGTSEWLAGLDDQRIRVIRHEVPRGLAAARNAGIAAATGEVIGFCDDDDLWLPDKLTLQLAAMRREETTWAFGGALSFTAGPRLMWVTRPDPVQVTLEGLLARNLVPGGGSNAIATRRALEEAGGFDGTLHPMEDWGMWISLAQHSPPAVVDDIVVAYRQHHGNMSRQIPAMLASARALDETHRELRRGGSLDWDDLYRWMGRGALKAGDRRGAIDIYWRAVRSGHPGASKRLLRALVPLPVRPPLSDPRQARGLLDRLRPRPVLPWPKGTESWLCAALEEE